MRAILQTSFSSILNIFLLLSFLLYANFTLAAPIQWQTLAPGIDYALLNISEAAPALFTNDAIYAFRINLQQNTLGLAFADEQNKKITTVRDLVENTHALLGINGGFFSPELEPLGLRVKEGTVKSPVKPISWWAVFYIAGDHAYIVPQSAYQFKRNIEFALQSGPRLIINGQIPALKPGYDARSALGITRDNRIVILATKVALSTEQVAEIMQKPENQGGLNCRDALNLDGGSSTQLYAKINNFTLDVPGLTSITDAVLVFPNQR